MKAREKWSALQKIAHRYKGTRYGQSLMSALIEVDKPLYQRLCGTDADCFYDDEKCTSFAVEVMATWCEKDMEEVK